MEAYQRYFIEVFTKNFANFSGRARRKEYWMFFLFNLLTGVGLGLIDALVLDVSILGTLYGLVGFIPGLAIGIRRLHDVDKSWVWLLIGFIPIIGTIWLLIIMATEGTQGENAFGPDPKAAE